MIRNTKLYKVLGIAVIAACLSMQACNTKEILEPRPVTALSDLDAFKTPDRIAALVNGLYASVKNGQLYGGRYLVYQDVRGEDLTNVSGNFVTAAYAYQHNQISSNAEVNNLWSTGYLAINRINVFLKGLDDNPGVVSEALANQYRAEARLLRALVYFSLVNVYAKPFAADNGASPGLPLRLQAEVGPGNNSMPRSKVAEIYAQIVADLNAAEQGLPDTYASAALRTTKAHKNTARALKSRVFLAMGDMPKVIEESAKIVSATAPFKSSAGVPHELTANVATLYTNYTTAESIFSFPMNAQEVPGIQNSLGSYYNPAIIGDYAISEADNSIFKNAAFTATDKRRTDLMAVNNNRTFSRKFNTAPVPTDFVPVIRYAEVLLNYAEAQVRSTNTVTPQAIALLNAVRGRSAPDAVYTAADLATPAQFLEKLYLERRIEFLCEGIRALDILRLNRPFPAKSSPALGAVAETAPNAANYFWPLPQNELDSNKDINK